jgi:ketosteroid isomerase-like protein
MTALGERDLATLLDLAAPDVEWYSFFARLGMSGVYRGHEGTREYVRDLTEAWEILRAETDDAIAVGAVALLVGRLHYRGRESGIEDENPAGWVLVFRSGRLVRFRAFHNPEQAIAAVGLQE